MLFDSSLRKDLARNFVATAAVILTIVMTIMLIRTLGQASRGVVNPSEVLLIMGFSLLSHLSTVLVLSLFISVISTLSRMYSDSEMVIWLCSGRSVAAFVPSLLRFAWPILLTISLLALFAWPWSNQQIHELRYRYEKRNDVERVAPGRFQESSGGKRVFFIDKDSPDQNTGTNVFIATSDEGVQTTTTARSGRIEWRDRDRWLALERGEQWVNEASTGLTRWTRFAHFDLLVSESAASGSGSTASRMVDSLALLRQPSPLHMGELSWRLGLGLSALTFTLLALPLAAVNPRRGRSYQYLFALLVFVLYYNLVNVGQNWIAQGRLGFGTWMLSLHGVSLTLTIAWLWMRHHQWSVRDLVVFNRSAKAP